MKKKLSKPSLYFKKKIMKINSSLINNLSYVFLFMSYIYISHARGRFFLPWLRTC